MQRTHIAILGVVVLAAASECMAAPCAGFTDVDDSSESCVNVEWMKNRGITLGLTSTTYGPNSAVTRLQMAAFMYRLGFQNAFLRGGNAFGATATIGTTDGNALHIVVNNTRAARYEPTASVPNVLNGFVNNSVYAGVVGTSIGGGGDAGSSIHSFQCWLAFGCQNSATDHFGTIGGGAGNIAGDTDGDLLNGRFGTVAGGLSNAAGNFASVVGGYNNRATGQTSTVLGGYRNVASGTRSIAGGDESVASGLGSIAIGSRARADEAGCIVFADSSSFGTTSCGTSNQFIVRALGGVYLSTAGTSDSTYTGAVLSPGSAAWAAFSDREGKEEVMPVDVDDVLRKIVSMPMSTWQWKSEPGSVRHMGPMAQDFHAAFRLGMNEKQIVTVDADGVALAAIQGLNAKLEAKLAERDAEVAELRREMRELRREVVAR